MSEDYFLQNRPEMLRFVPVTSERILDIGCRAGGFLSEVKKRNANTETWGIDLIPEVSLAFKPDKYLESSIESAINSLPTNYFDCIILNDVLEHLIDPANVLHSLKEKLSPNGKIVCSIPNVLHWSVLTGLLLRKDWKYENFGVMDKTHLRFFTKKSISRMFQDCNLKITDMEPINSDLVLAPALISILSFGYLRECYPLQWAVVASV